MKIAGIELPPDMAEAVEACRPHFMAAAVFSFFMNLLFLAPALYMLQVYDRVVSTGGKTTLLFITIALAVSLLALSALDAVRNRLMVRASMRLDALLAPKILKRMMARNSNAAMQAMRDFETIRQTIASPVSGALFDVPWFPLFLLVSFLMHFWLGILALVSSAILFFVAWRNQRATAETMQTATLAMAASQAAAQIVALNNDTVRALGMVGTSTSPRGSFPSATRSLTISTKSTRTRAGSSGSIPRCASNSSARKSAMRWTCTRICTTPLTKGFDA